MNTMPGGSSLLLCSLARKDAAGSLGSLPARWSGSTCPRLRDVNVKASSPSCIFTSVPSDRKDEEQCDQDHIPAARRREAWAIPCGRSGSPLAQLCCPALPKTPGFQDLLVVQAPDLLLGLQDLKGVLLVYTQNAHLDVWWLVLR